MQNNDKNAQTGTALTHGAPARPSMVRSYAAEPPRDVEKEGKKKDKKKKDKKDALSRGVETMFRTSYRTHIDMSGLADSKANIMISINGIIVSILLGSISSKIDANPWLLLPTTVMLVACLISLIFAVLAARPRVSRRMISLDDVRKNSANILFFGNFVSLSEDDYLVGMNELLRDNNRLYTNMIRDIYSLGSVLERKFRLLRTSYTIFMFGLIAGVSLFIIVYLSVVLVGTPSRPGMPI